MEFYRGLYDLWVLQGEGSLSMLIDEEIWIDALIKRTEMVNKRETCRSIPSGNAKEPLRPLAYSSENLFVFLPKLCG